MFHAPSAPRASSIHDQESVVPHWLPVKGPNTEIFMEPFDWGPNGRIAKADSTVLRVERA